MDHITEQYQNTKEQFMIYTQQLIQQNTEEKYKFLTKREWERIKQSIKELETYFLEN